MSFHENAPVPPEPQQLGRRGFVVGALATGGLAAVGARLLYLQGFDPQHTAEKSREKRMRSQTVPAVRGQILDINGVVLARSVQRYNIIADQTIVASYKRYVMTAILRAKSLQNSWCMS